MTGAHVTHWPSVGLGEVADLCLGKMLDAKKNKGRLLPYLANPNVRWLEVDTSTVKLMPFEEHEDERYGLRAGDVVVCEGGEAGRAAVWDGRVPGMKFQKAIHRVRPSESLDSRFLVYRLMFDHQTGRLADYYTGATIKHLTGQDLARYRFPLPPLREQRRIAAILDRANVLRIKRHEALAHLTRLAQSIFVEMFGDPVRNPKKWPKLALFDVSKKIQIGPFGSQLHEEDYVEGGIPLVNPTHIRQGRIEPDWSLTVPEAKYRHLKQYHLAEGDLILGRRGEMGRCAVISAKEHGWLCGTGSLFVRPNNKTVLSAYLSAVVSSQSMRRQLESVAQGVTMANLNKDIVGALPIALPPLELQRTYLFRIAAIEKLERQQRASQALEHQFLESLQHRAFRGEL